MATRKRKSPSSALVTPPSATRVKLQVMTASPHPSQNRSLSDSQLNDLDLDLLLLSQDSPSDYFCKVNYNIAVSSISKGNELSALLHKLEISPFEKSTSILLEVFATVLKHCEKGSKLNNSVLSIIPSIIKYYHGIQDQNENVCLVLAILLVIPLSDIDNTLLLNQDVWGLCLHVIRNRAALTSDLAATSTRELFEHSQGTPLALLTLEELSCPLALSAFLLMCCVVGVVPLSDDVPSPGSPQSTPVREGRSRSFSRAAHGALHRQLVDEVLQPLVEKYGDSEGSPAELMKRRIAEIGVVNMTHPFPTSIKVPPLVSSNCLRWFQENSAIESVINCAFNVVSALDGVDQTLCGIQRLLTLIDAVTYVDSSLPVVQSWYQPKPLCGVLSLEMLLRLSETFRLLWVKGTKGTCFKGNKDFAAVLRNCAGCLTNVTTFLPRIYAHMVDPLSLTVQKSSDDDVDKSSDDVGNEEGNELESDVTRGYESIVQNFYECLRTMRPTAGSQSDSQVIIGILASLINLCERCAPLRALCTRSTPPGDATPLLEYLIEFNVECKVKPELSVLCYYSMWAIACMCIGSAENHSLLKAELQRRHNARGITADCMEQCIQLLQQLLQLQNENLLNTFSTTITILRCIYDVSSFHHIDIPNSQLTKTETHHSSFASSLVQIVESNTAEDFVDLDVRQSPIQGVKPRTFERRRIPQ